MENKLKLEKGGADVICDEAYIDFSWVGDTVEINVFEPNGYDEHQESSMRISREMFDAIITHYKKESK